MSYTFKKIAWEHCNKVNETSILNEYGDIVREDPVYILARKQPHREVFTNEDGKQILTKSYFYVDPSIEPNALNISNMDKLDGETVISKYEMCDLGNKVKIVRFITV